MSVIPSEARKPVGASYPWVVVGLLWFCGFFNYADRQSVTAVFPVLQDEFHLSKTQLGWIASAFMFVYAPASPFAGYVVDRVSRRILVVSGLAFWSIICALTGTARSYNQLLFYRAAEGLGESCYFPASMSLLADYHGPRTRSRAMSIHQTSVYVGTAGGAIVAGYLAKYYGWRTPFWVLGTIGFAYAGLLSIRLVEPPREKGDVLAPVDLDPLTDPTDVPPPVPERADFLTDVGVIVRIPAAVLHLAGFVGSNFVAAAFMTWLPSFIHDKFHLDLAQAALVAATWSLASLPGALCGGALADWAARRAGGRMRVQGVGLILAAPLAFLSGWAVGVPLTICALLGVGFFKGVYDANIFASLYDVVPAPVRGTAAGLTNTVGWTGGLLAPIVVGWAGDRYGLSAAVSATAPVYVLAGLLAFTAAWLASRRARASSLGSPA